MRHYNHIGWTVLTQEEFNTLGTNKCFIKQIMVYKTREDALRNVEGFSDEYSWVILAVASNYKFNFEEFDGYHMDPDVPFGLFPSKEPCAVLIRNMN